MTHPPFDPGLGAVLSRADRETRIAWVAELLENTDRSNQEGRAAP
jgi:hypothetical protein